MNSPTLRNIQKSQEEYLELLTGYEDDIRKDNLSIDKICSLLDEIKCFWIEHLKEVEFELDELTERKTCFVLSGAVFLNISEHEHYYFKSFGDYHILPDPFLKMEVFFRVSEERKNSEFTVNYFKKAFFDTLEVLKTYTGHFYILPIHEMSVEDSQKHRELLDIFFWRFISSIFSSEFEGSKEFYDKYKNFEEIESDLKDYVLKSLIFNDLSDARLSLRERLEKYYSEQEIMPFAITSKPEAEIFVVSVYSYISQVADILYICSVLRINPYVRFDVPISYLTLIMYTFIEEQNLREIIEKALLFYIFHKIADKSIFEKVDFLDYCKKLEDNILLKLVTEKIRSSGIDIFKDATSKVATIIEETFKSIIYA